MMKEFIIYIFLMYLASIVFLVSFIRVLNKIGSKLRTKKSKKKFESKLRKELILEMIILPPLFIIFLSMAINANLDLAFEEYNQCEGTIKHTGLYKNFRKGIEVTSIDESERLYSLSAIRIKDGENVKVTYGKRSKFIIYITKE